MARHCLLTDLGSQGPLFTWCNKREEGLVCKKLNRVLLNDVALLRFSQAYSVFEPGGCSDHLWCRIQLIKENVKIKKPFKYINVIGKLPSFLPMVEEYWESTKKLFHSTSALFRFSKKLKSLKPLIRNLGREQLGNLTKRANEAHMYLCEKQKTTLLLPSADAIKEEGEAYERWLHVAGLEDDFLKQKSKLHWLEVGDQSNKMFHNAVRVHQAKNTMRKIICLEGRVAITHEEIKDEAVRFFSEFPNNQPVDYLGATEEEIGELIDFRCTQEDITTLEKEVTMVEIKHVLFSMPSNIAWA